MPVTPTLRHPNGDRWKMDFAHARTFGAALDRGAELWAEREALVDSGERVTYAQLRERSNRIATFLQNAGISKGHTALLRLGSTAAFFYAFFGMMRVGALPLMLRPGNGVEETSKLATFIQPTLLVTLDDHPGEVAREFVAAVTDRCPSIKLALTESDLAAVWQDERWDTAEPFASEEDDTWNLSKQRPERDSEGASISYFILSGGTTGMPKVIPLKPGVTLFSAACYADLGLLSPDDRCLVVMPPVVNFSMCCDSIATFVSGGTVVICPEASPAIILRLMAKERITHTSLVPAVARLCIAYRQVYDGDDISSLRYVYEGGARVTADLIHDTEKWLGGRVMNAYGMSEGFYGSTHIDENDDVLCAGLCQGCLPGYELRVVNAAGKELPPGELGEFQYRGSITLGGYYNNPDANEEAFTKDGYYHTGDLAYLNEEGYVCVYGRTKDQINRGGMSIMPEIIEADVRRHPLVSDCVALGAPDELLGQRIACFVIATDALDRLALLDDLRAMGVSEHHIPDDVIFVESYPQTPNQKVDRRALMARLEHKD